jgi:hypothetical protein
VPLYEIEHRWKDDQTNTVIEKVQAVIGMARKGQIPAGFRPVSIVAVPGKPEAHCLWEAPNVQSLEAVYKSLGVPTSRTIREVTPFFTA